MIGCGVMLIKIDDKNKEALLELCKANNIEIEGIYNTSREAFSSDEFDSVEACYKGIIGDNTINTVRKEVNDLVDYESENNFYELYESKLDEICDKLDSKPIAIYTISNNLGVSLIGVDEMEGIATIKVGNDIIDCAFYINDDGEITIKYYELELLLSEFVNV